MTEPEKKSFDAALEHIVARFGSFHCVDELSINLLLVVALCIDGDKALDTSFDGFIKKYAEPIKCEIFVPLSGIELSADDMQIGKGRLCRFNRAKVLDDLKNSVLYGDIAAGRYGDAVAAMDGTPGIAFRFSSTARRALELADIEVDRVASVLTMLASFQHGDEYRVTVEANNLPRLSGHPVIAWGDDACVRVPSPREAAALRIGDGFLENARAYGVAGLFPLLAKNYEDLSELERCVLDSVYWYAIAITDDSIEKRLTSLVTACELFFSKRGPDATERFAAGVSRTLAPATDQAGRSALYKDMTLVYDNRSRILHDGQREVTELLLKMRRITRQLIVEVLKFSMNLKNKSELWSNLTAT
jgi:Apea-like HEPN